MKPNAEQGPSLSNAEIRELKARAQRMKATLKVGKEGLSEGFVAAVDDALKHNELIKIKFEHLKEEKKELAPALAQRSGSRLIARVGNVAVLYRRKLSPSLSDLPDNPVEKQQR